MNKYIIISALLLGSVLFALPKQDTNLIILTEQNMVSLNMPIDGSTAKQAQQDLMNISNRLRKADPIYMVLNSPGGSVPAGFHIIETARGLPNPVHTITIFSASMSFIISQYLQKRYILESGTAMSHRAYAEGLAGQIPGNLVTRTLGLLSSLNDTDQHIAARAGMSVKTYQDLIRDELWMRGSQMVEHKLGDQVVKVRCDKSLSGPREPQLMHVFGLPVKVVFHKCPLIVDPLNVTFETDVNDAQKAQVYRALLDKIGQARSSGFANISN